MKGQIAEVRIWGTERSEQQIVDYMFRTALPPDESLVAYWSFNRVEGDIVRDSSGRGHDAKFAGGARVIDVLLPNSKPTTRVLPVLDLDGKGSALELPPHVFKDLDQATIEAWVNFGDFAHTRFYSYGTFLNDLGFGRVYPGPDLALFVAYGARGNDGVIAPGSIETNTWIHTAAVLGSGGMELYVNGLLAATDPSAGCFSSLMVNGGPHFLGRMNGADGPESPPDFFNGQIAEFRVWKTRRTVAEIREGMFRKAAGSEPGLAALWNFDGATNRTIPDAGPGRFHGRLVGNARTLTATLPVPQGLVMPTVVFGRVQDGSGKPVAGADLKIWNRRELLAATSSAGDGRYTLVFRSDSETFDVSAVWGDLGAWRLRLYWPRGQRNELNLTLSNAVSVAGRVAAFDQSSISDVLVELVPAEQFPPATNQLAPGELVTVSAAAGGSRGYRFVNVRPGEYRVRIHVPEGGLEYKQGQVIKVAPGQTQTADFTLAPFHKGRWRRYSTANGLPSTRVSDIQFMADGTLWAATEAGLSRFDGSTFVNLTTQDGLLDNRVLCIHSSSPRQLWIGTRTGLSQYDLDSRVFNNFPSGTNGLSAGAVFGLTSSPDGKIWIRTTQGLSWSDGQSLQPVPGIPSVLQERAGTKSQPLVADADGSVWTVTQEQDLWKVNATNAIRFGTANGLLTRNQDALHITANGDLWVTDQAYEVRSVARYRAGHFEHIRASQMAHPEIVTAIGSTKAGVMWFGHRYGDVTRYDPERRSFVRFTAAMGAPSDWVFKVVEAPDGALWFASAAGLYRFEEDTFQTYTAADGLPSLRLPLTAMTRKGMLWLSARGDRSALLRFNPEITNRLANPFVDVGPEGLMHNFLPLALAPDRHGGLWIGGWPYEAPLTYFDSEVASRSQRLFVRCPVQTSLRRVIMSLCL
jgi:streptogramin lyase